jgi:hypothetical protein
MYYFHLNIPKEQGGSPLSFMLEKLREYEEKYSGQGLRVIAYYVGDQSIFPQPDESMNNWIITDGQASLSQGMKNYWQYYGAAGSPLWFLIDRDGLAVETDTDFGKSLEQFFAK